MDILKHESKPQNANNKYKCCFPFIVSIIIAISVVIGEVYNCLLTKLYHYYTT